MNEGRQRFVRPFVPVATAVSPPLKEKQPNKEIAEEDQDTQTSTGGMMIRLLFCLCQLCTYFPRLCPSAPGSPEATGAKMARESNECVESLRKYLAIRCCIKVSQKSIVSYDRSCNLHFAIYVLGLCGPACARPCNLPPSCTVPLRPTGHSALWGPTEP